MYQVSLTLEEFTNHQRVVFSIWRKLENGGREQVLHDVAIVPSLAGGLFEGEPQAAVVSLIRWLQTTRPELLHTDE